MASCRSQGNGGAIIDGRLAWLRQREPEAMDVGTCTMGGIAVSFHRSQWALVLGGVMAFSSLPCSAAADPPIRIFPPHSVIFGKSVGEWSAGWYQWANSIPLDRNPIRDADGVFAGEGQSGPVFFLAGNSGGETERTVRVPSGKLLLLPILNDFEWIPATGDTCGELQDIARQALSRTTSLECEIDGVAVDDLFDYREVPPTCFESEFPLNNIYSVPPGTYTGATEGFYLMLEPIDPGASHTVRFAAVVGDPLDPLFSLDVTYHLTSGPVILPPHSTVEGKTLGEWGAEWWEWVNAIPIDRNPIKDQNGEFAEEGQSGPVFFLAGNFGGETTRTIPVPCGKRIFLPIVNDFEWIPTSGDTCSEIFAVAKQIIDQVTVMECTIDGMPIPDLYDYREVAPDCFECTMPDDNIWGAADGTFNSASDGYWLMLEPLSPGPHEIEFKAVIGDPANPRFALDITYNLTAEPPVLPPHSTVAGKTLGGWGDEWWKLALRAPIGQNPVTDPDGRFGHLDQTGEVFFLYGTFGPPTTRAVSVPCGANIFVSLFNDVEWVPSSCIDCRDCFSVAKQATERVSQLECTIDGVPVPDLFDHREVSPECFEITLPHDNVVGIAEGTYSPAASDGYWLMLEPLCPGLHEVRWRAGLDELPSDGMTYYLDVEPCEAGTGGAFRRGDTNTDGVVNLTDAVALLGHLFLGALAPECPDAADADDSGRLDLADAVYSLNGLFLGGPQPPAPGPLECGPDPTEDEEGTDLGCPVDRCP
jgi:hypothetical protein